MTDTRVTRQSGEVLHSSNRATQVTRESLEVLHHTERSTRVTRFAVEVLRSVADAGGTDVLTPDDLTTSAPELDSPALGQVHVLSIDDVITGAPVLDTPSTAGAASEGRITQTKLLAASISDSDARITQSKILVLHPVISEFARITQAKVLPLVQFHLESRITQTKVLALTQQVPCITYWATCVNITRTDGTVFAYTDHDKTVTFRGVAHSPCESLASSATEMSAFLGAVGNQELFGVLSDTGLSEEELYNGLFDGADIEVWVVPWMNAGWEIPFRLMAGKLGEVNQGVNSFNVEVLTPAAQVQQQALLHTYAPTCRFRLGDSRCTVDVDALEVSGTVTSVAPKAAFNAADRRSFFDNVRAEADNYFAYGSITWTSGNNSGLQSEVKAFTQSTGNFFLWKTMPYPIEVGDTYTALPGCDLRKTTCINTFDNYINFGGYPDVPGRDRLIRTPNSK